MHGVGLAPGTRECDARAVSSFTGNTRPPGLRVRFSSAQAFGFTV